MHIAAGRHAGAKRRPFGAQAIGILRLAHASELREIGQDMVFFVQQFFKRIQVLLFEGIEFLVEQIYQTV